MALILDLLLYVVSPRVILTHVIGAGLLFDLLRQGQSKKKIVQLAFLEEVITFALWHLIPNSWATILTLYLCIHIYERIIGPRVDVNENAKFLSDDNLYDVLTAASPDLNPEVNRTSDGRYCIETQLQYVEYSPKFWGKAAEEKVREIEVDEVAGVEEGCDYNIIRAIRSLGAEPAQCMYMTLGAGETTVTLIARSRKVRDDWFNALQQLYGRRMEDLKSAWLTQLYQDAEVKDPTGLISLDEAVAVLDKAKRQTDRAYIKEMFNTFAKLSGIKSSKDPMVNQDQFGRFFDIAAKRTDIHQIYDRLLDKEKGEMVLNPVKFRTFLADEQSEEIDLNLVKDWIRKAENILPTYNLTTFGFTNFLLSDDHHIMDRRCKGIYQDMRQPLSHYFIATSHNTYLTKDQLRGKSSVGAYISAFKRGCKCVELDCWDGNSGEPIIYHGHTLTSRIAFKDVIQGIKDYAFVVSDFPVILSFENHCSVEQQKVMSQHLQDILGPMMYTKQPPDNETKLPSPEDLKGYILVKAKKLKEGVDEADDIDDEFSDDETLTEETVEDVDTDKDDEEESGEPSKSSKSKRKSLLSGIDLPKLGRSGSKKKHKVPKIAAELSDLVAYCQATHFKSFEHSKNFAKHYEMSSFAEKKVMKIVKEDLTVPMLNYNKRQLSRIYPAGNRIDSSNYDPTPLWNAGCQLVALNYQTPCRSMQLNQGLFQDNGGCGYVLKPDFMRNENASFSPHGPHDENKSKTLAIQIISGHQLPYKSESSLKSERNLYVQVRISGVEKDNHKEKTKNVKNNGFNPTWNESMSFKVLVPDLAFLTFTAHEATATFLGQFTLPLRRMMQGYRRVPLCNKAGDNLPYASIFVHAQLKDINAN